MTLSQMPPLVQEQSVSEDQPFDLQAGLDSVERLMHDVVNSEVAVLRDASRHILASGGKRLRPRLVLLGFAAAGGQDIAYVAPLAAAIELVHTASVVHDDINDNGVVRRGRPSVNSIWGRTFALLTGDYLFTRVYELMAPYGQLNEVMSEATTALVEGETLQAVAVKEKQFTRDAYSQIIALKTAALFRGAAVLGARAASAPRAVEDALAEYGFNIGMAFQIVDDVLDLTASSEQLGKTAGIDVEQGRGFAVAFEADAAQGGDVMSAIRDHVANGDAVQKAHTLAAAFVDAAVASLSPVPPSSARQQLIDLAHSVIDRRA